MQPRIYTYKITFEEVPYYYYGSKKEQYFNEYYMGSPYTHKWCWELYTPKKQILELFEYTDEGYEKCREIEDRLIKPVLNDSMCLNENCGGTISLEVHRKTGRKVKELGLGIHAQTIQEQRELGRKVKELGLGIHAQTKEQLRELGRKSGKLTYELGIGIHGLTPEQRTENSRKGGRIIGEINGKRNKELGLGIFALTTEERSQITRKTNLQKWKCLKTGFITNAGNLTKYQRARGIDTSQRVRVE